MRLATDAEFELIRDRAGSLQSGRDTAPSPSRVEAVLVSQDGRFAYCVIDGILELVPGSAIRLGGPDDGDADESLAPAKQQVRDFYDAFGWEKDEGVYHDTLVHEDLRSLSLEYARKCHLRVKKSLTRSGGKFLLDVGSGPVQYPEYREFDEFFEYRICVDISRRALREAKANVGDRGIYILADATNLPFANNAVDAVVALHLLYHIPSDEQQVALAEIERVLRPGSLAVLVYLWSFRSPIGKSLYWLRQMVAQDHKRITHVPGLRELFPDKPQLYVHTHSLAWLRDASNLELDVRAYRSLSPTFMKLFIHEHLLGRQILRGIVIFEDRLPRLAGRLGRYPLLIGRKRVHAR